MAATLHTSPKRMSDDDVMDYVYAKLFNDLDGIESHSLFDEGPEGALESTHGNAEPESQQSGGVKITVEPVMKSAEESGRDTDQRRDGEEDEDEDDRLKGISGMSPLMAKLHGSR